MIEYVTSIWANWLTFVDETKIVGLFIVVAMTIWLLELWQKRRTFFMTCVVCVVLCFVPFTAMGLLLYQTAFYAYDWIWALIPMIPFLAYGGTEVYAKIWSERKLPKYTRLVLTALGLAICGLSISFAGPGMQETAKGNRIQDTKQTLEIVEEYGEETLGQELFLWAPREIVAYARVIAPQIHLYYGRDMWEEELDVLTDDRYTKKQKEDYLWMEQVGDAYAQVEDADAVEQIRQAISDGVNVILFGKDTGKEVIASLEQFFSVKAGTIKGYTVFFITPQMALRYQ